MKFYGKNRKCGSFYTRKWFFLKFRTSSIQGQDQDNFFLDHYIIFYIVYFLFYSEKIINMSKSIELPSNVQYKIFKNFKSESPQETQKLISNLLLDYYKKINNSSNLLNIFSSEENLNKSSILCINYDLIFNQFHLISAIYKLFSTRQFLTLKTKNLLYELCYWLSSTGNINEAIKQYSVINQEDLSGSSSSNTSGTQYGVSTCVLILIPNINNEFDDNILEDFDALSQSLSDLSDKIVEKKFVDGLSLNEEEIDYESEKVKNIIKVFRLSPQESFSIEHSILTKLALKDA